jgi:hypothetical protein
LLGQGARFVQLPGIAAKQREVVGAFGVFFSVGADLSAADFEALAEEGFTLF